MSPPTSDAIVDRTISYGRGGAGNLRKKSIDAAGYTSWRKQSMSAEGSNSNRGWRRRSSMWSTASGSSRLGRLLRRGSAASRD
ncbi:hypothetical protein XANCAGTX0491_000949 [Xanthoria calcicola]